MIVNMEILINSNPSEGERDSNSSQQLRSYFVRSDEFSVS